MENKLLEAYVDGFEMAKEIFTVSNDPFGLCGVVKASLLTTKHALKMSEYAKMDANGNNVSIQADINQFNNWLSESTIETRSDEFKDVFKITHGSSVVTGNNFLEMYDIFKSVNSNYVPR